MKHTLKSRTICLATTLAATAVLAGCSKEKTPEPYNIETIVYATEQNKVMAAGVTFYCPIVAPGFILTELPWYQISVTLTDGKTDEINDRWVSNDTLFTKKTFEPLKIVGIDVILLTDYDANHPRGSSIADQFDIETTGQPTMGMAEYFQTYGSLDWREERVCLLVSKTLPSENNETAFFDLSERRGFGAILRLTLEDNTIIETKPSMNTIYYVPQS